MFWMIFSVFQKFGFLGILGLPYCGIGATIQIGREILCLLYAEFFKTQSIHFYKKIKQAFSKGVLTVNTGVNM